jgi:hypothetical protein
MLRASARDRVGVVSVTLSDGRTEWVRVGSRESPLDEVRQNAAGVGEGAAAVDDGWFSVRCIVRFPSTFEERITLWRAGDGTEAVQCAEVEVRDYAAAVGGEYTGLAQAYELADMPGHAAEVFSLMRDSDPGVDAYLDTFFDTGSERQRDIDER